MAEAAPKMPSGYDYDFVSQVDDEYICLICHLPLRNPVLTRCGHRFCEECLGESLRRRRDHECPFDREKLDKNKDVFPDRASERKILSYLVKCPCDSCVWTGELRDVESHQGKCPYKEVQCPSSNCTVKMPRRLVEDHLANSCQWRVVSCPFCSERHPKAQEEVHRESCAMVPINCVNGCEQVVPRMQMSNHLENVCLLTPVPCPYHNLGCSAKVERRNFERHVEAQTTAHLSLACKKLVKLQGEFDHEKTALKKQLEDLKKENDNLSAKVSLQEKEMFKRKNEAPTFMWKITNFSEILKQAKNGRNTKIDSDSFYTGTYGYKLKVSINPNGDGSGKNSHLSVFVVIVKGEYDAVLPWPFHQKVTFTLVDQQDDPNDRENVVMQFTANTKLENFGRPKTDENPGRGYARFISHEKLRTKRFVVDDVLFIQVLIDTPSEA